MQDAGARPARAHIQTLFQLAGGALALCALMFAPPAAGRMALVPLTPGGARLAPAAALASGALLIGRGRLPGSLIVEGERGPLLAAALESGSLLVSPNMAGCGR